MKKFSQINESTQDHSYKLAQSEYNEDWTWEYNLQNQVRWDSDDAPDDMCFYVKAWLEKIADEEGYKLVKKDRVHKI